MVQLRRSEGARGAAGRRSTHSDLRFNSRLERANSSYSFRIRALKSAPHIPTGKNPWLTSLSLSAGTLIAAVNQPASWEVVSFGVFAGANNPDHASYSISL